MVNKKKQKGTAWENQLVKELNDKIIGAKFKRIVGSGALGTVVGEPLLCGDLSGEIESYPKRFRGEAKAGYNNSTGKEVQQFTIKKLWLDKIAQEAQNTYSIPFLACKFDNARSGVKHFIVLDVDVFVELMNNYTKLKEQNE